MGGQSVGSRRPPAAILNPVLVDIVSYLHVKTNAMRTAHLEKHAVMNNTQITVQEPGTENGVTFRIWRWLTIKRANKTCQTKNLSVFTSLKNLTWENLLANRTTGKYCLTALT